MSHDLSGEKQAIARPCRAARRRCRKLGSPKGSARAAAFTLVEVVFAAFALGVIGVALCACLSSGFTVIQSARENLRATQIMMQRTEAIRLFNWNQVLNTNYLKPTFTEYYDPQANSGNQGVAFSGVVTVAVPTNAPAAYRNSMRTVTVSLSWTNFYGKQKIPHNRQMQTQIARYGMQNYVWGNQ